MKITPSAKVLIAQSVFWACFAANGTFAADAPAESDMCTEIRKMTKVDGVFPIYKDETGGRLFIAVPEDGGPDFLFESILTSGMGSRDINSSGADALDRGKFGNTGLVSFRHFGPHVLLIERNTNYYTQDSVLDSPQDAGLSFANAVLISLKIECHDAGKLIVDATDFFQHDWINIPESMKAAGQGSYSFEKDRSVVDIPHAHGTDQSVEVDSLLSFSSNDASSDSIIARVAADKSSLLAHQRTALVRLPDLKTSGFKPRDFDPRSGFFDNTYYDPSVLPYQETRQSFILRHYLAKKNPDDKVSVPTAPIIFYIDPAIPKDLRPLIAEGVSWWNSAFEQAGYKDAIQVRDLPSDIDPFDVGVNVILWVPRETRGYSVGGVIADPRTGQILKAIVRLDAMRLQADRLLFDALTTPYGEQPNFEARDQALKQRFRLLVAHEIGHTLGLRHQYIASAQSMSSVMDYPFPSFSLDSNGVPVLRDLFPQGVEAWDRAAIYYGYHPFLEGEEAAGLRSALEATEAKGAYWITDEDTGDAHPLAQKWDRGVDPVLELERVLALRQAALIRFSKYAIPSNQPLSALQDALVPLYLLHQFEVKAVASMLSGYTYRYAMRDEQEPIPVPPSRQRQALKALLVTLDVDTLWPGQQVLELMSPRPPSYPGSPESFSGDTGKIFDALRPVEDATSLTMKEVLKPERAARLAQAKARDPGAPDLDEVLGQIVAQTWKSTPRDGPEGAAQRAIALVVLRSIVGSATSKTAPLTVRGACWAALDDIHNWIESHPSALWKDADAYAVHAIAAVSQRAEAFDPPQQRTPVLDPMGEP